MVSKPFAWAIDSITKMGWIIKQDGTGSVDLPEFLLMMTLKHQAD
jgi:hypothetical protein